MWRRVDVVFNRQSSAIGSGHRQELENRLSVRRNALFRIQMNDHDAGSKILSQIYFSDQQRSALWQQGIHRPVCVYGQPYSACLRGLSDKGPRSGWKVLIVPTRTVRFFVREPFERVEAAVDCVVERFR